MGNGRGIEKGKEEALVRRGKNKIVLFF